MNPLPRPLLACAALLCALASALRADASVQWLHSLADAQAAATASHRPIYLHLADPLNELTGAMARQTFANAEVAAFLNTHFVCLQLDRDNAPDLAGYGQQWLAADQKLPGWPLNLWFTPELGPIESAAYLPPTEEWGREGFMVVAQRIADRWAANPDALTRAAANTSVLIADYLPFAAEPPPHLDAALLQAAETWLLTLDPEQGTFGDPPHRLEPELLRFLLARGGAPRAAALASLKTRILSPLRDPLDGGFYRATADTSGHLPVFQKRLTDQARFALTCLDAAAISDDPLFPAAAQSALDYVLHHLRDDAGRFLIGDDATDPTTTTAQTWTWDELVDTVGADTARALGARPAGNVDPAEDLEGHFRARNILSASPLALSADAVTRLQRLRHERAPTRLAIVAPAGAHALVLHALQRSADELGHEPHRAAALATRAILERDFHLGTAAFAHTADGAVPATAEDIVLAALALNDPAVAAEADTHFYDADLGCYTVTRDEVLGLRPLWWATPRGELPSPMVWRVLLGDAPAAMVRELTLPLEQPHTPAPGDTLLALQKGLTH